MVTLAAPSPSIVLPRFIYDESFESRDVAGTYSREIADDSTETDSGHLSDQATRDLSRRMHYAAYRASKARNGTARKKWLRKYLDLRDSIVVGNRKLVYHAVRRRTPSANRTDDAIGHCHIVLIQAVAAFNPWLGIRFSTYAYTCLLRALARLERLNSRDKLARAASLSEISEGDIGGDFDPEPASAKQIPVFEYLRDDHPLLTPREKAVLSRRFSTGDTSKLTTLATVGRELGISTERVRQVQLSALGKLRVVLRNQVGDQ